MGLQNSKNLSSAKKTCDEWFSRYIRIRDANANGLCKCVTCDTVKPWREMDCGHFQSRRYIATRWLEQNAHAQCQSCNKYQAGEQYKHGRVINDFYGEGTAEYIAYSSRALHKMNKQEVMELARYFKQETETLAKEKNLEI